MKIALVILHADPARGGAERYTADLAEGLCARGHEVFLIASTFPSDTPPCTTPDIPHCGKVHRIHIPTGRGTRLGRYRSFLSRLDDHLEANQYDIVHAMLPVRRCDVYHPHAGIAAEAIRSGHQKYSSPVARTAASIANQINIKRRAFEKVERELLSGANPPIVLCLSEYVKRDVLAHYALPPDRLATLFNAVDVQKFDPDARSNAGDEVRERFNIAADRIVALMIAQDFARKGLREAILALSKVEDERLVLLVVGKQNPAAYQRLAVEREVGRRVIFAGSTTDPYSFYRAADFFLLPTRHDPCSLVVLEALAMGLPVISTAMNGACEIMTSGKQGFVLPDPSDVHALSDVLVKMLGPGTRAAMSSSALALRPRLAYQHHLDELLQIYVRIGKTP